MSTNTSHTPAAGGDESKEMTSIHLWEIDHPYYCNEGNYFKSGCGVHYSRWQDFIDEQGDNDLDMNLLFRFDWVPPHDDEDPENPILWQGDEHYRDSVLKLFYMGQRKGYYRWVTVDVCRADEPAVREWLQIRWTHMMKLWEPLANARLIAAAPDLLEACKAALAVLDGSAKDDVEPGAPSGAAMNLIAAAIKKAAVMNSIADAIEKATGRNSGIKS